jgi:hypothetical protein
VTRLIDDELVILDRKGRQIHQLNETATRVWSLCDGRRSLSEIGRQLARVFDVVKKAAYVAPAVLALAVTPSLVSWASTRTPGDPQQPPPRPRR